MDQIGKTTLDKSGVPDQLQAKLSLIAGREVRPSRTKLGSWQASRERLGGFVAIGLFSVLMVIAASFFGFSILTSQLVMIGWSIAIILIENKAILLSRNEF
jgi:hypothetical protein